MALKTEKAFRSMRGTRALDHTAHSKCTLTLNTLRRSSIRRSETKPFFGYIAFSGRFEGIKGLA
jgi:hypothetical protein